MVTWYIHLIIPLDITILFWMFHVAKIQIYRSGLFNMTNAAITPGTQPQSHNKKVIRIEPQPLSKTAKGGQMMESITRQILIIRWMI